MAKTSSESKKDSVVQDESKWTGEKRALKKVQMHFNFVHELHKKIHHVGAEADLAPSDVVRKIVGLSYTKIRRPRIGLSFDENDLNYLAERYGIDADNKSEIKRKVMDETAKVLLDGAFDDSE